MPSPTETLFRVQASPVPTHTIFELDGSIVTAPMDCTDCRSNTGLNVVPPLMDFHTPPLADPAKTVSLPFSLTAVTAAIRPLIVAEPMLRAGKPDTVAESNLIACCAETPREKQKKIMLTHSASDLNNLLAKAVISEFLFDIVVLRQK